MDSGGTPYTFVWFIENYRYHSRKAQNSPRFPARQLNDTSWYMRLHPDGFGGFSLSLHRAKGNGPETVSLCYELSVLGADGSPLSSVQYDQVFTSHIVDLSEELNLLNIGALVSSGEKDYLPQDTLSVCCKILKSEGNALRYVGQCSARTRFRVEKVSFVKDVRQFSTLKPLTRRSIGCQPHSNEDSDFLPNGLLRPDFISRPNVGRSVSCSLYTTGSPKENIMVEILPSDSERILQKCELYLLDSAGDATECGGVYIRCDPNFPVLRTLTLPLTRKEVLRRRSEFLPNDKLSLFCKCTFSDGLEFEAIEETVHEMPLAVKQKLVDAPTANACDVAEKISACPSALDDLKALYVNNSFTDVELKTKTKSFRAHKAVLCARSPVFGRMLSSDMREKNTDSIFIDDLQDDVVQQFLLLLYSDTVENLDWTMATRLYYAADKYEVGKLREVCSSFLVANLTPGNAVRLLLLADTHGDADLRRTAEEFILENEEGVFGSEEWERLMEANPVLAMKTMHLKYKRRRLE